MTDDRIEGAARAGIGHLQDAAGGLIGDDKLQAKGKLNRAAGGVQDAYGKAKDQVENAVHIAGDYAEDALDEVTELVREHPLAALGVGIGLGFLLGLVAGATRR